MDIRIWLFIGCVFMFGIVIGYHLTPIQLRKLLDKLIIEHTKFEESQDDVAAEIMELQAITQTINSNIEGFDEVANKLQSSANDLKAITEKPIKVVEYVAVKKPEEESLQDKDVCQYCGKHFERHSVSQRFCSTSCACRFRNVERSKKNA